MGTEWAFVSDATGEAYELGRGPWYEWQDGWTHTHDDRVGPPRSREDVAALLDYLQECWQRGRDETWTRSVEGAIWSFVEVRPDARVVSDLGDYAWDKDEAGLAADRRAGLRAYQQVGSRYEHAHKGCES